MPALYFLPLLDQTGAARPEHLHAAITSWLDPSTADWNHRSVSKPYAISPITEVAGHVGIEISVLTESAERLLREAATSASEIRLGSRFTRVGNLQCLHETSWDELAAANEQTWRLDFLTPTTFRTGNRCTPMPTLPALLRSPSESWRAFAPVPLDPLSHAEVAEIWTSELDLHTEWLELILPNRKRRAEPRSVAGVLGSITYQCDNPEVAAKVGPLFRLVPYCGIGSFRGKGMGVVRLGSAA
ncbi:MAG: CRISPR system precrRNA processing endoribonuclease RAMP protein Cas6 [Propionibacterium sp.]|nr:CRISPR system precrRNA processing endoribonuclease RAMP protein Cas6 [Propionibacterium sp.]